MLKIGNLIFSKMAMKYCALLAFMIGLPSGF